MKVVKVTNQLVHFLTEQRVRYTLSTKMAPKLYGIRSSQPVRAVLICAKALNIQLKFITVNLFEREQYNEDFLKKNPQHTVPVLEDEDGFIVSDSHAIMGYLVAKYGKDDSLYPKHNFRQRAIIDHRLHFDTGILFSRGMAVTRPVLYQDKQPTQDQLDALREAFQILEKILNHNKSDYIAGNKLSIADFSIIASITSWRIFIPFGDFPNIEAYVERLQELPCFEENKEGLQMYYASVEAKLQK